MPKSTRTRFSRNKRFGRCTALRIEYSDTAKADLESIKSYIAEDNPAAAERTIARILQSIRFLKDFPRLGRVGLLPDTRELSIIGLPYRAVYRIEGDTVLVATIVHGARQLPRP
jgi:toxin ParE1/3/4